MTYIDKLKQEFNSLQQDLNQVPNFEQAKAHEKAILLETLKAIASKELSLSETHEAAKYILENLRFV